MGNDANLEHRFLTRNSINLHLNNLRKQPKDQLTFTENRRLHGDKGKISG